jgi:prepilin-type N-terminal cleavage/methylation domain-containing protein
MINSKSKSFTLPELLVVMIITAIVIGMAFSVLRLVQKQIRTIQTNFEKTTTLALFEQKLWQDFNEYNSIQYNEQENSLQLQSEIDTVVYNFKDKYTLRNNDTIKLKLMLSQFFMKGIAIKQGDIDAITVSGEAELPNYEIFVSKKNDLTLLMNLEDGL